MLPVPRLSPPSLCQECLIILSFRREIKPQTCFIMQNRGFCGIISIELVRIDVRSEHQFVDTNTVTGGNRGKTSFVVRGGPCRGHYHRLHRLWWGRVSVITDTGTDPSADTNSWGNQLFVFVCSPRDSDSGANLWYSKRRDQDCQLDNLWSEWV